MVWDTYSGQQLCDIRENKPWFQRPQLALTSDGKLLFVKADRRDAYAFRIYETTNGRLLRTIEVPETWVDVIACESLPNVTTDEEAEEYFTKTGRSLRTFAAVDYGGWPYPGFNVSPNGEHIWMQQFHIPRDVPAFMLLRIDAESGEPFPVIYRPPHVPNDRFDVQATAIGAEGKQLFALATDGFAVFRIPRIEPIRVSYDSSSCSAPTCATCAFAPDGQHAAWVTSSKAVPWGSFGASVTCFQIRTATKYFDVTTPDGSGISSLAYTKDSGFLLAGTTSGRVLAWWNNKLSVEEQDQVPNQTVTLVASSDDSRVVTSAHLTPRNTFVRVNHWNIFTPGGLRSSHDFRMPSGPTSQQN